jgi:hypothetical protein
LRSEEFDQVRKTPFLAYYTRYKLIRVSKRSKPQKLPLFRKKSEIRNVPPALDQINTRALAITPARIDVIAGEIFLLARELDRLFFVLCEK